MHLGEMLVERDIRIVCGMGLNVGDAVVKGALLRLYDIGNAPMERLLALSPFPRNLPDDVSEDAFNRSYRERMIAQSGAAIFIAGTSRSATESRGVLEEFAITRAMGRFPIPIGATGFAARRIWEFVSADLKAIYGDVVPRALFNRLNDPGLSNETLLQSVLEMLQRAQQSAGAAATPLLNQLSHSGRRRQPAIESDG
jgi:hypothetical protein